SDSPGAKPCLPRSETGYSDCGTLPREPLALALRLIHPDVASRMDRLEIPFGPQGFDPYGAGKTELGLFFTALRPLYRRYFTVHSHGIGNIPARGRAMIVGNH